jgi:ribosomal protein S18 acetylase RimI-like enzyme
MGKAREELERALPGLTVRSATPGDVAAATAVVAACEIDAHGFAEIVEDEIAESWARPTVDLAGDVVLVLDDGIVVAWAETYRGRGEGYVHPSHRRRGIGTALVEWWTARAAERGNAVAGQTVSDDDPTAVALLERLGCTVAHTSWILTYPLAGDPPVPARPPDGIAIRLLRPGEERALFHLIDDAFSHWKGRARGVYEDWAATTVAAPRWERWMGVVAVDGNRLVGAAVLRRFPGEGWVDQIAVAGDYQGRGIGRALLQHAFGVFHGREPAVGLSTDSRTGALDLYLHVGMTVRRTYRRWSRPTGATLPS